MHTQVKATQTNATLRRKVQEVQTIAEQELGFVPCDIDRDVHHQRGRLESRPFNAFLFVVQQRIVGLLLTETITQAFVACQDDNDKTGQSITWGKPCKANLGIHLLWVKASHRNKGIATKLLDTARERLVFGYTSISPALVAFSSPTQSGLAFAQAYMKRFKAPLLVYQFTSKTDKNE
jgi:GNAT superfamily N-acetyltransferase